MSSTTTNRPASRARSWYAITNKANDEAEIKIYEDIGAWGITAKHFTDELETVEAKKLHVRLNTGGGDVFDGIAIHNALRAHAAEIIVHVDGLAASAGSLIAMSGDEIRMADNAFLMIHEARGGVFGEADDMRKYAEALDKINDVGAGTYQGKAGKTRKYWRDRMAEETWYTADEAKAEGLCDCVDDRESASVSNRLFDFKIYNLAHDVPEEVRRAWGIPSETNNAPEGDSPRGDSPPAGPIQEPAMATDTQAAPAQNSGAVAAPTNPAPAVQPTAIDAAEARRAEIERLKGQTAEATFEQGRAKGMGQGRDAERERLKAIAAVCPGRPEMAINAFLGGQTPEAVKLAYDEAARVEAAARIREQEMELETMRWKNLAASGGYPAGIGLGLTDPNENGGDAGEGGDVLDAAGAKQQAEAEWDHKPGVRKASGCRSRENYVAFRAAQLQGRLRVAPARQA